MPPANADLQKALDTHNSARAAKGVPALVWSDSLTADAQAWANKLLADGKLSHSSGTGQGENLGWIGFSGSAPTNPTERATLSWLAEGDKYNGEAITSDNVQIFGHYTQCMWKNTTQVGIAYAGSASAIYTVARYSPQGNFIGQKPY